MSRRRVPFALVQPDRRFQALQLAWLQSALASAVGVELLPPMLAPLQFAFDPRVQLLLAARSGAPWSWKCSA